MMTKITHKAAADKMEAARINLLLDHYFFGRLAMHLKLVERLDIPTLAVDGRHIFYNPQFVMGLRAEVCTAAYAHEILHPAMEHFLRRGNRNAKVWNMAGDYVNNLILKDSGFRLGEGWLCDEKYRDMTVEHVYDLLMQDGADKGKDPSDGPGTGEPGGALDDILDGPKSEGEAAEMATEWRTAVEQAAQMARQHGKMPASLERFVKELQPPQVPWREVLQRFICDRSKNDYSWTRASKKHLAHGYYLPSLYSEDMGILADAIDTSGSIDGPTLSAFGSEVTAAVMAARPEKLFNIYCDARVNHVDEYQRGETPEFKPHGGGGTDFRPPFDWIAEQGIQPACFVYLTDGYGPFPEQAPEYPVLWVMTTDVVPPWGEYVRIRV